MPSSTIARSSNSTPGLMLRWHAAELITGIPRGNFVTVGDVTGHVERKACQHNEPGEVPVGLQLVLWRMVGSVVEIFEGLGGEVLRLSFDPRAGPDGERGHPCPCHRKMVRPEERTEMGPGVGLNL